MYILDVFSGMGGSRQMRGEGTALAYCYAKGLEKFHSQLGAGVPYLTICFEAVYDWTWAGRGGRRQR